MAADPALSGLKTLNVGERLCVTLLCWENQRYWYLPLGTGWLPARSKYFLGDPHPFSVAGASVQRVDRTSHAKPVEPSASEQEQCSALVWQAQAAWTYALSYLDLSSARNTSLSSRAMDCVRRRLHQAQWLVTVRLKHWDNPSLPGSAQRTINGVSWPPFRMVCTDAEQDGKRPDPAEHEETHTVHNRCDRIVYVAVYRRVSCSDFPTYSLDTQKQPAAGSAATQPPAGPAEALPHAKLFVLDCPAVALLPSKSWTFVLRPDVRGAAEPAKGRVLDDVKIVCSFCPAWFARDQSRAPRRQMYSSAKVMGSYFTFATFVSADAFKARHLCVPSLTNMAGQRRTEHFLVVRHHHHSDVRELPSLQACGRTVFTMKHASRARDSALGELLTLLPPLQQKAGDQQPDELTTGARGAWTPVEVRTWRQDGSAQAVLGRQEVAFVADRKSLVLQHLRLLLHAEAAQDAELRDALAQATPADVPVIAVSYSGGGVRALLSALGATVALQQMGLYQCTTYSAGVSGGSWFQALWMQSQLPLSAFRDLLRLRLSKLPWTKGPDILQNLKETLQCTASFFPDESLTLTDIYGAFLAFAWFKEYQKQDRLKQHLSEQALYVRRFEKPLPLYSCVRTVGMFPTSVDNPVSDNSNDLPADQKANEEQQPGQETLQGDAHQPAVRDVTTATSAASLKVSANTSGAGDQSVPQQEYEWVEVSPFEVQFLDQQLAVPTDAFGRQFWGGRSLNVAPEQPLAMFMGICGSAFCANVTEMSRTVGVVAPLLSAAGALGMSRKRIIPPSLNYNPAFGLAVPPKAALQHPPPDMGQNSEEPLLELVDAGVCINAAIPPFLRPQRGVDIVLLCDSRPTDPDPDCSKDVLQGCARYLRARGVRLPSLEAPECVGVGRRTMTVLTGRGNGTAAGGSSSVASPDLVYLPFIANASFSGLQFDPNQGQAAFADFMHFKYRPEHFDAMVGLAHHNVAENQSALIQLVKDHFLRKYRARQAHT